MVKTEKMAGELFFDTHAIVKIDGRYFARGSAYIIADDGDIPRVFTEVYLRCDKPHRPIPYNCMALRGVTEQVVHHGAEFVLEPPRGLSQHILVHNSRTGVSFWEAYSDDLATPKNAAHDAIYLEMLGEDAKRFFDSEVVQDM